MSRSRILAAVGLATIVAVMGAQTAQAYVIFGKWSGHSAGLSPAPSLPSSFYSGNGFGAMQWNQVTTSNWTFSKQTGSGHDLSYGPIDGSLGILAETTVHFSGSTITDADVLYDSAENWYTGSGTPGASQVDLRSIATHELGHVTGLDHTQSSNCPGLSSDPTMCPFYSLGSTNIRSLEADDRNGLSANYPGVAGPRAGQVAFHALYPRLSDQTLAGLASVAFQGAVRSISPARWNTTGGALWKAGPLGPRPLPFHLITFRLDRPIRGG